MMLPARFFILCPLIAISVACAPVNPNMPREIRYVQEDSCSDALAQAFAIANRGDPGGQYSMGRLWERGCGVPRHHRNAYDWFMLAANGGDVRAILKIGDMHKHGHAVERDDGKAAEWYSLAARMDSGEGRAKIQRMGRPIPAADLPTGVDSRAGRGWIAEFAEAFLIGAAAYYGARAGASAQPASSRALQTAPAVPARVFYQTNCFVNSIGNFVNVDCLTR